MSLSFKPLRWLAIGLGFALTTTGWSKDTTLKVLPDDSVPFEFTTSERVVTAGDLHGNLDGLVKILQDSKLVDQQGHWIGGKAIFLSPGDVLDGNRESVLIVKYIMDLEKEAEAAGGKVITTYGNHELMVSEGDVLHVTKKEATAYEGVDAGEHEDQSIHSFFAADSEQGRWIRSRNQAVKITQVGANGAKTIIGVHSGFDNSVFKFKLEEYNATARAWVKYWQYKARTKELLQTQRKMHKKDKKIKNELDQALEKLEKNELPLLDETGAAVKKPPNNTAWVVGYEPETGDFDESAVNSPSWARFNKIKLGKDGKPLAKLGKGALTPQELDALLKREGASTIVVGHEPNPDDSKLGIKRQVYSNPNYAPNKLINLDTRIGWAVSKNNKIGGTLCYSSMDDGQITFHNDLPIPKTGGVVAQRMASNVMLGTSACTKKIVKWFLRQ